MSNKIYVGNLSYKMTEDELHAAFSQYGEIVEAILIKDRDTGRLKGFGFVEFATPEGAKAALVMDGQELEGRKLKVNEARAKTEGGREGGRGGREGGGYR